MEERMKRYLVLAIFFAALVGSFALTVNADSTITIPVPEKATRSKEVVLSLKIPPNTEAVVTKEPRPKLQSRSSLILWDSNPVPIIPVHDEFNVVLEKFNQKGWVKGHAAKTIITLKPMQKYHAVRVLQHILNNIIEIAQSPNMVRTIRKTNLVASDIEDLRRMVAKYNRELTMFGESVKKVDKDLLMLQERYKTAKSGVLKVIKVEGVEDGGTVIHLGVD